MTSEEMHTLVGGFVYLSYLVGTCIVWLGGPLLALTGKITFISFCSSPNDASLAQSTTTFINHMTEN